MPRPRAALAALLVIVACRSARAPVPRAPATGVDSTARRFTPAAGAGAVIQPVDLTACGDSTAPQARAALHASASRDTSAGLSLELNLPAYRVDVFRDGERVRSFRVAVGQREYPTPRGAYRITRIVWNPWWIPPPGEWARKEHVTPPSDTNPMGRVKLYFLPYYFLHGTPYESSLGTAGSHGCVRMTNAAAIELARIVQAVGAPEIPSDSIDSLVANPSRTRGIELEYPVPLRISYRAVEVRNDSLIIHPDIYGLLTRPTLAYAVEALLAAGYDTAEFDRRRLAAAARPARGRARAIPLDSLRPRTALGP